MQTMIDPDSKDPDFKAWLKEEVELGIDEILPPATITSDEGLARMSRRLEHLKRQKDHVTSSESNIEPEGVIESVARLNREILDTEKRILEYKIQNEGRN